MLPQHRGHLFSASVLSQDDKVTLQNILEVFTCVSCVSISASHKVLTGMKIVMFFVGKIAGNRLAPHRHRSQRSAEAPASGRLSEGARNSRSAWG